MRAKLFLILVSAGVGWAADSASMDPKIFNHKVHVGSYGLKCNYCHPNPNPGDKMTIATGANCMKCHSVIKRDSPEIAKLAGFIDAGKEVSWTRVYQLPSYVEFSHRTHTSGGIACATCHGKVEEQVQITKVNNLSMAWCVDCHRALKFGTNCTFCHDHR